MLYISWDKEGEAEAAYQELLSEYGDHKEIAEVVDDVPSSPTQTPVPHIFGVD